jgi:antitoxin (DNA-binding transcriptional repressor) of toxin-antitoxin stability system
MKEISISDFKARSSSILKQLSRSRRPIAITRFGKPVATLLPGPRTPGKSRKSWLRCMEGSVKIIGDIVGPTGSLDDWEAWRD